MLNPCRVYIFGPSRATQYPILINIKWPNKYLDFFSNIFWAWTQWLMWEIPNIYFSFWGEELFSGGFPVKSVQQLPKYKALDRQTVIVLPSIKDSILIYALTLLLFYSFFFVYNKSAKLDVKIEAINLKVTKLDKFRWHVNFFCLDLIVALFTHLYIRIGVEKG